MNSKQNAIHERAVKYSRQMENGATNLVFVLQEVMDEEVHRACKCNSLFTYATTILNHSRSQAYMLVQLARRSRELPVLDEAIRKQHLQVSMAGRLLSSINKDNAEELIAYARAHTYDEVDKYILGKNPKAKYRNSARLVAGNVMKVTLYVPVEKYQPIERLQVVRGRGTKDLDKTVVESAELSLDHHDPMRKAERAQKRKERQSQPAKKVCAHRQHPTAAQKHETNLRTRGRCTFVDADGVRCNEERWTDMHHVIFRSQGGGHETENLTTLCGHHHDVVHQLPFPGMETAWSLDPCT